MVAVYDRQDIGFLIEDKLNYQTSPKDGTICLTNTEVVVQYNHDIDQDIPVMVNGYSCCWSLGNTDLTNVEWLAELSKVTWDNESIKHSASYSITII
jgi:hypothetical protein